MAISVFLTTTLHPDSEGYINYQWDLSEKRAERSSHSATRCFFMPSWPCFGLEAIPLIHDLFTSCSHLLLFIIARHRIPIDRGTSGCGATSAWSQSNPSRTEHPDRLACTFAQPRLLGCLQLHLGNKATTLAWIWLATITFITYQVRPAYLFILVLCHWPAVWTTYFLIRNAVPLQLAFRPFAWLLTWRERDSILWVCNPSRNLHRFFWNRAFGGYNTIGIAVQFLDAETISKLPDDTYKSLAKHSWTRSSNKEDPCRCHFLLHHGTQLSESVYQVSSPVPQRCTGKMLERSTQPCNRISWRPSGCIPNFTFDG